jgi:arylsulfatase A-like enzyme
MDDLGYGDFGYNTGLDPDQSPSPFIDRLASESYRLNNHYSVYSICSPARATLLSGKYAARFGINGVFFPKAESGFPDSVYTVAERFQDADFKTGLIGKWHLGSQPEFLPTQHGFDHFFGLPYSNDMEPLYYLKNDVKQEDSVLMTELTSTYTREALNFIDQNQDSSFFLMINHSMPHIPIPEYDSTRTEWTRYEQTVLDLDLSVKSVHKKLEELGILGNTMIVITSDHGPWLGKDDQSGSAGILRSGKFSSFEGGHRVPGIMYSAEFTGGEINSTSSFIDWYPTLCDWAGIDYPKHLDGISLLHALDNQNKLQDRPILYFENSPEIKAIRYRDWKLKMPHPGTEWANLAPHDTLLFNLKDDPGEEHNLLAQYPEQARRLGYMLDSMQQEFPTELEINYGFW